MASSVDVGLNLWSTVRPITLILYFLLHSLASNIKDKESIPPETATAIFCLFLHVIVV